MTPPQPKPLIAITSDLMIRKDHPTAYLTMTYAQAVHNAGAIPVILPPTTPDPDTIATLITRFDAFILSGGDDPKTEPFGHPTHPKATPVLQARQTFETALIKEINNHPDIPVLGICLGMQMLALCNDGELNQHLPDTHKTHADHWNKKHPIISTDESILPSGTSFSSHRQAITNPGTYQILATAPDGIIEAIHDPAAKFRLAIQWHPERTEDPNLGQNLFNKLVQAIFTE
ncbi:MAG: gamma-glutamyl-gamma-aminobutyrate hydrolase family protein [Phycisphaerales bacterium]|nr:gamma-glutamyl-gamma-aminobutyrate hydrolase family protein [Phycisphaerales bacterium]